jgi:hypothetical protein
MIGLTMSAGSRSLRSSSKDQVSGRSRVNLAPGSIPEAYCVAPDETVKIVRLEWLARSHVCSTPTEAGPKHFGQPHT